MSTNYTVVDNQDLMQFEVRTDDELAYLTYRFYKKDIAFMHTVVPEKLSGKGIATALAKYAFEYAAAKKKKVMVYCPFVGSYVKKNPELKEQLDSQYHK